MAKLPPLDDAMRARFAAAREAERVADASEPRARDAYFDRATGRIVVELKQGGSFAFPPTMYPELASLSAAQLSAVRPFASGEALEWEEPDVHIAVAGVLVKMLGPAMLRAFAQRGGSATSERKAAAARANGARGGRPRTRTEPGWSPAPPGYGVLQAREQRVEKPSPLLPEHADLPGDVDEVPPPGPKPRRGRKRSGE
jgi:hypothetical protein